MPTEKEKWLNFHDRQYQFKVPFMMYADFGSFLKTVSGRYRDKMNRIKADKKRKVPYTENTRMYHQDGVFIAPLPMEMSLILKNVSG